VRASLCKLTTRDRLHLPRRVAQYLRRPRSAPSQPGPRTPLVTHTQTERCSQEHADVQRPKRSVSLMLRFSNEALRLHSGSAPLPGVAQWTPALLRAPSSAQRGTDSLQRSGSWLLV